MQDSPEPGTDVRNDPIGPLNHILNRIFMGRWRLLRRLVVIIMGIELPLLRHPLRMAHPYGIVVNAGATLGRNVTLFQGVTIGSKRSGRRAGVPVIGDNVVIYPNAVIIGRVVVGNGATIGAGAVVVEDVPAGAVAVGNPARILTRSGDDPSSQRPVHRMPAAEGSPRP